MAIDGATTWLTSIYLNSNPTRRGHDLDFLENEPDLVHKNSIIGGDFNCVADTNIDTKLENGSGSASYSNDHSVRWEALAAHYGLCDIYRLHHGDKANGYTRYNLTSASRIATRIDRIYGPRHNSPWRWTTILASHELFSSENTRSDHLPVEATVETARARKSTSHELKIDTTLYADLKVRRQVSLLWAATYKDYPPNIHSHATTYTKAKEAASALLRQLTREKKQKLYPTTTVRNEIAQVGLMLGARGPKPHLILPRSSYS